MEQFPPIFVISLKNSPRRDIIAQRLNGLNSTLSLLMVLMAKHFLRMN